MLWLFCLWEGVSEWRLILLLPPAVHDKSRLQVLQWNICLRFGTEGEHWLINVYVFIHSLEKLVLYYLAEDAISIDLLQLNHNWLQNSNSFYLFATTSFFNERNAFFYFLFYCQRRLLNSSFFMTSFEWFSSSYVMSIFFFYEDCDIANSAFMESMRSVPCFRFQTSFAPAVFFVS